MSLKSYCGGGGSGGGGVGGGGGGGGWYMDYSVSSGPFFESPSDLTC